MASPNPYPAGLNLAGTVFANGPATLQLGGQVYLSGLVQWLDTINGNDANPGSIPERPVKTLAQAVTNSAANGVIVIGAGSAESISVAQTINLANLSIFGCGTGSSRPRYTSTGAVDVLNVTAAGVWIEGIYFPASTSSATDRINLGAAGCVVKDCYFECGTNDGTYSLQVGASGNNARIDGCSFVTTASRPAIGLAVTSAVTDTVVINSVFDGGSFGWSDYALKVTAAATRLRIIGNTFINRADLGISVTGTSYQIYGNTIGGTGNVLLTS